MDESFISSFEALRDLANIAQGGKGYSDGLT